MADLFNFENKLGEVEGPFHKKFKSFCEKFNFNTRTFRTRK